MRIERESGARQGRHLRALGLGLALCVAAVLAHVGRIAESPVAGAFPALAAIAPGKIGQLRALKLDSGGQPPANADQIGREALAGAPLAYEPFFAAALSGFRGPEENGSQHDGDLLREARRRNPRSREAHVFLMRHELGQGNLKEAIDEIAVLNRLTAAIAEQLIPAVGKAISSQRQVDDVIAALAPHPELFEPFLRGFATPNKPAGISQYLISRLPKAALDQPKVRNLAVKELVKTQSFAEARKMWGETSGQPGLIHSSDFADSKAPPPFNWELVTDTTGATERQRGGGVSIAYYGRDPGALASQLITLPAGSYRARLTYRTTSGTPGAMGLQLRCAGQAQALFDQPLDGRAGAEQVLLVSFTVPAQSCQGQIIALAGRMQENRDPQEIAVRRLEVLSGGAK